MLRGGNGGSAGIRTQGRFPYARFRIVCLKPGSATLPFGVPVGEADYIRNYMAVYTLNV